VEVVRFALLGLGTGAVYSLLAQGLVLVYRGSGLLNFAQGAMAMVGAFAYYEATVLHGLPTGVALVIALALCGVLGAVLHLLILRPMSRTSPLSRVIATLGVTIVLQATAFLRYGHDPLMVSSLLPTGTVHVFSQSLPLGEDRLWILGISALLTLGLTVAYRVTAFGRVTTAVAENQVLAASLGYSPDVIAACNWALGSVLAGLAGVLIAPIIFLEPTTLVLLILPAMSAALLGQFASFPMTFGVALVLGMASSEVGRYIPQPGWASAAPFIVVIVVLLTRGQVIPLRSFVLDRLPPVGDGRVRLRLVAALYAAASAVILSLGPDYATPLITTLAIAIICLSVVVITGYAGQLSLAQAVLAGIGALVAARLSSDGGLPFPAVLLLGALAAAVCGGIVGLPALRTRGVTLAIATLGLGGALVAVVLNNASYTGGQQGIPLPKLDVLGWSIDPLLHSSRYAFVTMTVLLLLCIGVANLRRGVVGRRLLAVRANERASAALGLPAGHLKAYAFSLSAGIAGAGGVLLAFAQPYVQFGTSESFTVFTSILLVAVTVVGGVGLVGGSVLGATLVAGGIVSQLLHNWTSVNDYLPLMGGIVLVVVLRFEPGGLFLANRRLMMSLAGALRLPRSSGARSAPTYGDAVGVAIEARALVVRDLSVSFGGVHAVRGVDLSVLPGEIHGLIGPNGAGKTTLIDAITGFVAASSGLIRLGSVQLEGKSARKRAIAGISRSFQSLELFDELTVLENLAVASERLHPVRYLTDLIRPGQLTLQPVAREALRDFELEQLIDRKPSEISFGQRKTVAIARAVAAGPSILLLDEPAAGLDDHEAAELATLIVRIAREWQIGVLLVEHKVDMITAISDRITVLENGAVLATGDARSVLDEPAVIDAYLGTAAVGSV
jgi:ABC-type branched-subunit amino acid transport system ATPase component/ABC-type branched-subunit amino acid transport system permease subunit